MREPRSRTKTLPVADIYFLPGIVGTKHLHPARSQHQTEQDMLSATSSMQPKQQTQHETGHVLVEIY